MMKKILTLTAALLLMTSGFAQLSTSRGLTTKEIVKNHLRATKASAKTSGNPLWGDTMSYCGNETYVTGIGTGGNGVYWGIKMEAAALVGRNTIESVQLFIGDASNGIGTYSMNICQDSLGATPLLTQSITAVASDTMSWKTITLATPLSITQGHDLFVWFYNADLPYPASAVSPNDYDNGKWASIDGVDWDLVGNLGANYTWMIRVVSDTHIDLPPMVTIEGPSVVRTGDTAVFTAVSPNADSYSWNVTADYTSASGNTLYAVWETGGTVTVEVSATNTEGTTVATLDVDVIECNTIDNFPYILDFETPIPCWLTVSMDPANDDEFGITSEEYYEGLFSFSFSSYNSADDYNQYLISPEIDLPAGSDYMLSFMYYAYNSGDLFRVMASTTNSNISSFTTIYDMSSLPAVGEWMEAKFPLPAGTKYVAIDYYGNYAYYLYIDSLSIDVLSEPAVMLTGNASVGTGIPATFTAISTMADTFTWSVDGTVQSVTGAELTYTFTTVGTHTVEVSATNSVGTTTESMDVEVFFCDNFPLPYTPDFSDGLHCWTSRSDGEVESGWFACAGSGVDGQVYSLSAVSYYGIWIIDIAPDNWLYSPTLTMPDEGSYDLCWKVMTYVEDYPTDHYAVYIIDENGAETMIYEETLGAQTTSFSQRVANIPSSVSGTFKVAFRHYNTEGGYAIILDEIKIVTAGTVTGIDAAQANVAIYPNPVSRMLNVSAEGLQKVEVMDMAGRTVMTGTASHIDLGAIADGVYMVRVTTAQGIYTEKIVKK